MFCKIFDVSDEGNVNPNSDPHGDLKGKNVLRRLMYESDSNELVLSQCLEILKEKRNSRQKPHLDDKIICGWNSLMISGLCSAYSVLNDIEVLDEAIICANFIISKMFSEEHQTLFRIYKDGSSQIPAFAEDYSFFIQALIDLYQVTLDEKWLLQAKRLQGILDERFWDEKEGGYFVSSLDLSEGFLRLKDQQDGAEPCSNTIQLLNLHRLKNLTGDESIQKKADLQLNFLSEYLLQHPTSVPIACNALLYSLPDTSLVFSD